MDEELFEEESGLDSDDVEDVVETVSEAPEETGNSGTAEIFESVPSEEVPQTTETNINEQNETSPYEWITDDWNTIDIVPSTESTSQLIETTQSNTTSENKSSPSNIDMMNDLFGGNVSIDGATKNNTKNDRAEVIERLQSDFKEIEAQYPTYDQDSGYGTQLQEVAPTKEQLEAAKEKGFNKDFYDYATANATPEQWDENAFGWGLYNGDYVPMAAASEFLEEMKRSSNRGNEKAYNEAKENFLSSIEKYQELKAYVSTWNEDGTLAQSTDDKQKTRDIIAKTYLDNRNNLASAMQSFIDDPNKKTYSKYNEALKTQNDETYKAADAAIADVLNKADKDSLEWAEGIMAQDPLHNEELLEAFAAAEQTYFDTVKNEKERARLEEERKTSQLEKERAAVKDMDKDALNVAYAKGEISKEIYNERTKEIDAEKAEAFQALLDKGLENLTTKELSDNYVALQVGPNAPLTSEQYENLYNEAQKREQNERLDKSKETKDKAIALLEDEDKANDLAALNLLNQSKNESGTVDFSASSDDVTYTNPTTGEVETKSTEEFLQEIFDPESEFNKSENWADAISSLGQQGVTSSQIISYLRKVDPTLATFLQAAFVSDWDVSNTLSEQQYVDITNRLKEALSDIWGNTDSSWISKAWDTIKTILSSGKEYKEATKQTQIYQLIRSAQSLVTRGIATAIATAVGTPLAGAAIYAASLGKDIIADRLRSLGYEDAANIMSADTEEKNAEATVQPTTNAVTGKMISKAGAEPASIDYKGYNKGLEEEAVARKDVPSDFILKVFKKEPKSFAWIKNV